MTVDYSKIDFTKCKLEPLSDLPVYVTSTKIAVSICSTGTGVTMLRKEHDSVWHTNQGALYLGREWVNDLFDRGDTVDAFIATETARIEAEENAANWVQVPWQDVEWLDGLGATVKLVTDAGDLVDSVDVSERCNYRADRRTFPAGYDPTMPRWVEVDEGRYNYLRSKHDCNGCYVKDAFRGSTFMVDIHTIPPGVPLHEEPKPEPRLCSKEFALSHYDSSQVRWRAKFGPKLNPARDWSNWQNFDSDEGLNNPEYWDYEFRTTAKEDGAAKSKTMTCIEFTRLLIDSNQEKYILVNGKHYGYRFNREHCRIETGVATDHGTVDWGPSFGLGAASDVITVTE